MKTSNIKFLILTNLIFSGSSILFAQKLDTEYINGYTHSASSDGIILNASASHVKKKAENVKKEELSKKETAVDTAGIEVDDDLVNYFVVPGQGGSVVPLFGSNPFFDEEYAQIYPYFGSGMNVESVLLRFWGKTGTDGSIEVKVYNTSNSLPTTVLGSKTLSISDIDTTEQGIGDQFSVVAFDTPVNVTKEFAVGYDVSGILNTAGTSWISALGAWATAQDEPHKSELARIKPKTGSWLTLSGWAQSIGLTYNDGSTPSNSNFLIYPVVSDSYATGFDETEEINGIKLSQSYPNPSKNFATIEYQIKSNEKVMIELVDANGKIILVKDEGKQDSGKHKVLLDVSQLPAGNYYYLLTAGADRLAKSFVKE